MTAGPKTGAGSWTAAPDGSPVELYERLSPGDVPRLVSGALGRGADVLELGCGVGRTTHELVALGHPVVAVDQSPEMLAHVRGAEVILGDIEALDLDGRRFAGVLLASHLVNTADEAQRAAFLATCRRHLAPGGAVLVQRHDPDAVWVDGTTSEADGVVFGLCDVRRDGPHLSATVTYDAGGRRFEHAFSALILDDAATDAALGAAGLVRRRFLDDRRTWIEAGAAGPHRREDTV